MIPLDALTADRERRTPDAAAEYERALAADPNDLSCLLNLTVLYWVFPNRPEMTFWTKYIAWADLNEPFEVEECRELLREHPCLPRTGLRRVSVD